MGFACCPVCSFSYVLKAKPRKSEVTAESYAQQEMRITHYQNEVHRLQKELDSMIVNSDNDLYEELQAAHPWLIPSDSSSVSGTSDDEGSYLDFDSSLYAANHRRLVRLIAVCKEKEKALKTRIEVGVSLGAPWVKDRSWVPPVGTSDRKRIDARNDRSEQRKKERREREAAKKMRAGDKKVVHNVNVMSGQVPSKWIKSNPNSPPPPNFAELQRAKKGWVTADELETLDEEAVDALKAKRIAEWKALQSPLPKFERSGVKKQRWATRAYNIHRRTFFLETSVAREHASGNTHRVKQLERLLGEHKRRNDNSVRKFEELVSKLQAQGGALSAKKLKEVFTQTSDMGFKEVAAEKARLLAIELEATRHREEKERKWKAVLAIREARAKDYAEVLLIQRRNKLSEILGCPSDGDSSQIVLDGKITLSLVWSSVDKSSEPVQCDLSCVAVSVEGELLNDCSVYPGRSENNDGMRFLDSGLACGVSDEQKIVVDLKKSGQRVRALVVLATVANKSFLDVSDWQLRILANEGTKDDDELFVYSPPAVLEVHTARFLCRIVRNVEDAGWTLSTLTDYDSVFRDFGSLTPEIKSTMLDCVPGLEVDLHERTAYMKQGACIRVSDFGDSSLTKPLVFAFSWRKSGNATFSASAICLDDRFQLTEGLNATELSNESGSIVHHGEINDEDSGDNERISLELSNVPLATTYIGLVVSSAAGKSLHSLQEISARLNSEDVPIAHYGLSCGEKFKSKNGVLLAVFHRLYDKNQWILQVAGIPGDGRTNEALAHLTSSFLKENSLPPLAPIRQIKAAKFEMAETGERKEIIVKVPAGSPVGTKLLCTTPHGTVWTVVPLGTAPGATFVVPVYPRPATKKND